MKKVFVAMMTMALATSFATASVVQAASEGLKAAPIGQEASSFLSYEVNGFVPGSVRGVPYYVVNKYDMIHRATMNIPSGVKATYTFAQQVSKTSNRQHTFESGISGSVGTSVISEVNAHVNYNYVNSTNITYQAGQTTNIEVSTPGSYTITWYNQAQVYSIVAKWWGYTVDAPNTRKQLDRTISTVKEPKKWETIEVVKN